MQRLRKRVVGAFVLGLTSFAVVPQALAERKIQVFDNTITLDEVLAAQKGWCSAVLAISDAYQKGGFRSAKAKAESVIDTAYGFQFGPVAFKPTYAIGDGSFRQDRAGALAYFVGPDPTIKLFGKDQGFATYRHWTSCDVVDDVVQLFGQTANTMGFVKLVDAKGGVARPEKTWTFWKTKAGSIRIVLHHSSLPFDAR
jgi:hypothetical protein